MNYNQQYITNFEADWNFNSINNTQEINDDYFDFSNEYFSSDFQSFIKEKDEINLEELDDFNRVLYNTLFGYEELNNNTDGTEDLKEYVFPYNGALYSQDGLIVEPIYDTTSNFTNICGISFTTKLNENISNQAPSPTSITNALFFKRDCENISYILKHDNRHEKYSEFSTLPDTTVLNNSEWYYNNLYQSDINMDTSNTLDEKNKNRKRKFKKMFERRRIDSNSI
uniref:Uncharacterized protein n=1 Tax=Strongyloides stercoralis TaxID=6248 RepID=A0A0K0EQY2_STRER